MTNHSITDVGRATGLTSRTLRHYESLGLISSLRAPNGYREFDDDALVRLQRILVLRALGMNLSDIADVLAQPERVETALATHAAQLRATRDRIDRQLAALDRTTIALTLGEPIMTADPFDGFDHTQYQEEVTQRWGADAYRSSDRWWRDMSSEERAAWKLTSDELIADWSAAAEAGEDPAGPIGQALAERQANWLRSIPGTPNGPTELPHYLRGLGEMYVADDRFGVNYGGSAGASFVRDALAVYADALESSS